MSLKRIVLLGIVVAALALYYNIKEVKIAGEKKRAEELKAKIFPHSKDDIAEFKLEKGGQTFRVKRVGKGWRILEPIEDSGDQMTLDNMAANLTNSITLRTLIEDPKEQELDKYGLDDPYIKAYVKLKDGSKEGPALIGDMSPFGGYSYIKRPKAEDNSIYLANALFRKGLDKSLYDMRDKAILHLGEGDLKEIRMVGSDGEVKVEKNKAGEWRIVQPAKYSVDGTAMKDMFDALKKEKIERFFEEEPTSLEPYGLDQPAYRFTFSGAGDGSSETILVGSPVEGGQMLFAKYLDEPRVFAVGKKLWDKLPKSLFDFRNKRIVTFSNPDIEKLEIKYEGIKLTSVKKADDEWYITSPQEMKGSYYAHNNYFYTLKEIEATSFTGRRTDSSPEYGFHNPYLTVKLWPQNAEHPITLMVGAKTGEGTDRYAAVGSDGELVTISQEAVDKLKVDLMDMRDRVITSFQEQEVKKIVMKFPGAAPFILQREGEEEWRLLEPAKTKVEPLRVKSTLWRLEALSFNEIISEEDVGNAELYGFQEPSAKITLWGADESKPLDIITLGGKAIKKDNIYVRVKSKAGVYTTDADILDRIPRTVELLKTKF